MLTSTHNIVFVPILITLLVESSSGQNIVRHACGSQAEFFKIASNHVMDIAKTTKETSDGLSGCVDLCTEDNTCKSFNYKRSETLNTICELLTEDRNTKADKVVAKTGWDYYDTGLFRSQVGQYCRSLTYNPCYPCLCIDSCYHEKGYTCNCTADSPPLPEIYIAFESTLPGNSQQVGYDRGTDMKKQAIVKLVNGAKVEEARGRPGKVLKVVGTNAGAVVGNFYSHPLNNPGAGKFSISYWIRFKHTASNYQTILGSGTSHSNTGILMRVKSGGEVIFFRVILSTREVLTPLTSVRDTLKKTWAHVVTTHDSSTKMTKIYVNGRKIVQQSATMTKSASGTAHPNLIIGAASSLIALNNDYWNMQMDDLTVWKDHILTDAEIVYIQNKGYVV